GDIAVSLPPSLARSIGLIANELVAARVAGQAMNAGMLEFLYAGESHEAATIAEKKPTLERTLKEAKGTRRDPRYIKAQLERYTDNGVVHTEVLEVGKKHRVNIRIGPYDDAWINPSNLTPFPNELLPTDEDEHELLIVVSEPHHIPKPLVTRV